MPKEKINHAPLYIEALAELQCRNGCVPPAGCSDCPNLATIEVSNIAWNPVAGAEPPGAWLPDGEQIRRDAELCVGWQRESWVQLSIEADPAYFKMAAQYKDGEDDRTSVYTPPLSRDEVNKLIRSLRRARDQVFGRDE